MPPLHHLRTALSSSEGKSGSEGKPAGDRKPAPHSPAEEVPAQPGLSSEQIANRLYPRPAEPPRKLEPPRKPEPVPAPPAPQAAAPRAETGSVVSRGSVFDGTFESEGDLTVEGEVRGTVNCKGRVLIREGATVQAKVDAASLLVAGQLNGDVTCSDRFEAAPTARVSGHLTTPRLVVQEGARCDGQITMSTPEPNPPGPPSLNREGG